MIIATLWHLWKQRNARVFNRNDQVRSPSNLASQILEEIKLWRQAGVGIGGLLLFVRVVFVILDGVGVSMSMFASLVDIL